MCVCVSGLFSSVCKNTTGGWAKAVCFKYLGDVCMDVFVDRWNTLIQQEKTVTSRISTKGFFHTPFGCIRSFTYQPASPSAQGMLHLGGAQYLGINGNTAVKLFVFFWDGWLQSWFVCR